MRFQFKHRQFPDMDWESIEPKTFVFDNREAASDFAKLLCVYVNSEIRMNEKFSLQGYYFHPNNYQHLK